MSIIRDMSESEASNIGDEPGDVEIGVIDSGRDGLMHVYQRGGQFFAIETVNGAIKYSAEVTEDDPIVREARP